MRTVDNLFLEVRNDAIYKKNLIISPKLRTSKNGNEGEKEAHVGL